MKQQTVYTRLDDNLLNIIKDVYVFTPEELLAHDKQVASDALKAALNMFCLAEDYPMISPEVFKEEFDQYLNTIK